MQKHTNAAPSKPLESGKGSSPAGLGGRRSIEVFLVGAGTVGGALLDQMESREEFLASQGIDLKLCGIANSRALALDQDGIPFRAARERLALAAPFSAERLADFAGSGRFGNPVLVDCTSSPDIARAQLRFLERGVTVVTANKKANTFEMPFYLALRRAANEQKCLYLYETTVGAALPVIDTLQNLIKTGDEMKSFAGILSGSLSYIFGRLDDGIPFSKAVQDAKDRGFTEPDPRDDLSGTDVARKLLILIRESGKAAELTDIRMDSIFPEGFDLGGSAADFMDRLPDLDPWFAGRAERLRKQGKALRFTGEIGNGSYRAGLAELDATFPLHAVKNGENALVFYTKRYDHVPLVLRGYGAGATITAGGVFADILRTVPFNLNA